MTSNKLCPTEKQLRELLDEKLQFSEQEWVSDHIEQCPNCQSVLERLTTSDTISPIIGSINDSVANLPQVPGYQLIRIIGRGGMGVVASARRVSDQQLVAIKFLAPSLGASSGSTGSQSQRRLRFAREARALSQLEHPNIVRILDTSIGDTNQMLVMELLGGGSLTSWQLNLRPIGEIVQVIISLAEAVQYAHDKGVIHRDLKPSNIVFSSGGVPKITDFGLARIISLDTHPVTISGEVLGTPSYIAPEQLMESRNVGPPADIYSLGAILYALLTGKPPHSAETPLSTIRKVLDEAPATPRSLTSSIPQSLEWICLKCLEKSPRARYASCTELADDLRRFTGGQKPLARRPSSGVTRHSGNSRFNRRALIVLPIAAVAMGTLASFYTFKASSPRIAYFAQFDWIDGKPVGQFPLSSEQASRRYRTYRMTILDDRIVSIEAINGRGELVEGELFDSMLDSLGRTQENPDPRECRIEIVYDEAGSVVRETALNRRNQVVWIFRRDSRDTGHFTDVAGFLQTGLGTNASYIRETFDGQGRLQSNRFVDAKGNPVANRYGIHRIEFNYSSDGLITTVTAWDLEEQAALLPEKVHRRVCTLDENGNISEFRHFDELGNPTHNKDFYHQVKYTYDSFGNQETTSFFASDGSPCLARELCHRWIAEYDRWGNRISVSYFDTANLPCRNDSCAHRIENDYNDRGYLVGLRYFDEEGIRCNSLLGWSSTRYQVNRFGETESESYFSRLDAPMTIAEGYHRIAFTYNDKGYKQSQSYFDEHGQRVKGPEGVHSWIFQYDANNNRSSTSYLNTNLQPCLSTRHHASDRGHFNEFAFLDSVKYFDINGNPCDSEMKHHEWRATYDRFGNELTRSSYNSVGNEIANADSYHQVFRTYDRLGRVVKESFRDIHGAPCRNGEQVHAIQYTYDNRDRNTEIRFFDEDDLPCDCTDNFHRILMSYNSRDRLVESQLFHSSGEATNNHAGWHKELIEYDSSDQETKRLFFDKDELVVALPESPQ